MQTLRRALPLAPEAQRACGNTCASPSSLLSLQQRWAGFAKRAAAGGGSDDSKTQQMAKLLTPQPVEQQHLTPEELEEAKRRWAPRLGGLGGAGLAGWLAGALAPRGAPALRSPCGARPTCAAAG